MKFKIILFFMLLITNLYAADFGTLRKKLFHARETLLTFVNDSSKRGADQQKLVKESADEVSQYLKEMKTPNGKEKQFEEYKALWAEFKNTRESQIVPNVLKGNQSEADKLTNGIQKERLGKMNRLLDDLEGKDL